MQSNLTTLSAERANIDIMEAIAKYGATLDSGEWRQISRRRNVAIMEAAQASLYAAAPVHVRKRKSLTIGDCGYHGGRYDPVYKIAMYCITRFEHDTRKWWIDDLTLYVWDETRRRRFTAMMIALGFRWYFRVYRKAQYTPEEIYAGELLASDLGLSTLAIYAEIFGGDGGRYIDTAQELGVIVA